MIFNEIKLFSCGGVGDQLLAFSVADLLIKKGYGVKVTCSARDEVYKPLNFLLGKNFNIFQISEGTPELMADGKIPIPKDSYLIWPDLIFQHPNSFPFQKFGISLQQIRSNRFLQDQWKPKKIIYCALNTSTDFYTYEYKQQLIDQLALLNPDYTIYYNNLSKWNNKSINNEYIEEDWGLPLNCSIEQNQPFCDSLEILKQSCYCVTLDNGLSHASYFLGIPRLLISRHINNEMHLARWYHTTEENVSYNFSPKEYARLVKLNLDIPQTQLIPRQMVMKNLDGDWKKILYFKY